MEPAVPGSHPSPRVPPDVVALMQRGVSVNVASRDARLRPSVMRAMASHVNADASEVTVWLARRQCGQMLQDLATTGAIAVMFSEPSTHRTVQLKATRVRLRDAQASDQPVLDRYLRAMEEEIAAVGYPAPLTRAMLACSLDDLVAASFRPEQVFEQTPGPQAGKALGSGS